MDVPRLYILTLQAILTEQHDFTGGLLETDETVKGRFGKKFYNYVDYCRIEPVRQHDEGYFCTPIVMTILMAMASRNNVVVAETLDEFFGLGYYVGWFALEQLAYD